MYLCRRVHENQLRVGGRCLAIGTHADFHVGMNGTVFEIVDGGVSILWDNGVCEYLMRREMEKYLAFERPPEDPRIGTLCANCRTLFTDKGCACTSKI
jgi:hypothetical protein